MDEREEEKEERWALMQEPATTRAPRHFVRVKGGPHLNKLVYTYS